MTDHRPDDDGNAPTKRAAGFTYDIGEDELPSEAVVRAVAAITNTPVIDLDPLYDVIDPDYLDGVLEGSGDGEFMDERSVTFSFNGHQVTVTRDAVRVGDSDRAPD